jgi:AcrR family transcriptional regulator
MNAVSRHGTRKLSVTDICDSSRIARGTFYRYFNSKDDVLVALGRHFEDGLVAALAAAIEENPDPERRVHVVLDTIVADCTVGGDLARMLDAAPTFTMQVIRDAFPGLVDAIADTLGPAADTSPLVVSGALTARQLSDLVARSLISTLFLGDSRSDEVLTMVARVFTRGEVADAKPRRGRR